MKFESIFIGIVSILKLSYFFFDKWDVCILSIPSPTWPDLLLMPSKQGNKLWLGDMCELASCLFCIQNIISSVWTANEGMKCCRNCFSDMACPKNDCGSCPFAFQSYVRSSKKKNHFACKIINIIWINKLGLDEPFVDRARKAFIRLV